MNRKSTDIRFNLSPFWEYRELLDGNIYFFQQIRDNILLFVPFGFMLPTIFKKYRTLRSTFIAGLLFSISIELLQLITARGLCEFDDVFNNTLGAVIGYLGYKIVADWLRNRSKSTQQHSLKGSRN